jgi:hypothetical protein
MNTQHAMVVVVVKSMFEDLGCRSHLCLGIVVEVLVVTNKGTQNRRNKHKS